MTINVNGKLAITGQAIFGAEAPAPSPAPAPAPTPSPSPAPAPAPAPTPSPTPAPSPSPSPSPTPAPAPSPSPSPTPAPAPAPSPAPAPFTPPTLWRTEGGYATVAGIDGVAFASPDAGCLLFQQIMSPESYYTLSPLGDNMYQCVAWVGIGGYATVIAGAVAYSPNLGNVSSAFAGGPVGTLYIDRSLYPDAENIPSNGLLNSNIAGWGSSLRTISSSSVWADNSAYWVITYDATGLTGTTSTSDTFDFYW